MTVALAVGLVSGQPAFAGLRKDVPIRDGMHRIYPGDGDYLVVLHGWTTGYDNMKSTRRFFSAAGYHVVGLRFPSRTVDPQKLIRNHIKPGIEKHCTDPARKIHFLTHSLGGVLLRGYLKAHRPPNLGNVVMLAPPNNGIELIDRLGNRRAIARFIGPTALALHTGDDSWPKRLGKADFPVGIIMGKTKRRVPYSSRILPGSDDGIVSAASGKVEGMRQLIEVTGFHTSLPANPVALAQSRRFFETGKFAENHGPKPRRGAIRTGQRWMRDFAPKKR